MARKKPLSESAQEIELEFGEKAIGMSARSRAYFFYVTPTKQEVTMKECPHMRVSWMRGGVQEDDGTRSTEMGLVVTQPVTLKMVVMPSAFGKMRQVHTIYIDLDPSVEKIQIEGPGDGEETFGRFKGRGIINEELSKKTKKQLGETFSINVLAGPRIETKDKNVRSLIF